MKIFLSLIICGLAQVNSKAYARGAAIYAVFFISLGWLFALFAIGSYSADINKTALLFLIASFTWLYNLLDVLDIDRVEKKKQGSGVDEKYDDMYVEARLVYFKGDLPKAKECFEAILKKNSGDMDTVYQLAKINAELGNKLESKKLFKRYLKSGDKLEWVEEAREALRP